MRVAPSVRAVSISGGAAVTTISSAAVACFKAMFTVSVWPTPRSRPFCTTVAKPCKHGRDLIGTERQKHGRGNGPPHR